MNEEERERQKQEFKEIAKEIGLLKSELEKAARRMSFLFILSISISTITSCLTLLLVEI